MQEFPPKCDLCATEWADAKRRGAWFCAPCLAQVIAMEAAQRYEAAHPTEPQFPDPTTETGGMP